MNWGKSIVVVYALFVVGIVYLVYRSSQQSIELVDKNYYQNEILYQHEIDATAKASKKGVVPKISKIGDSEYLIILDSTSKYFKGTAHFYCPSNSKNDVKMELIKTDGGKWEIPSEQIKPSSYQVKVNWVNDIQDTFQWTVNYSK